ncbi:Disease resistance protein [Corchorus olitorius]|uniref:Disease resistance protein n=1 Tax=Corchorus olitorius TaxID=93759 RepID=A0A1R3JF25_9ROSI|nr:Disease resistance protein [Corchorus olitorius]
MASSSEHQNGSSTNGSDNQSTMYDQYQRNFPDSFEEKTSKVKFCSLLGKCFKPARGDTTRSSNSGHPNDDQRNGTANYQAQNMNTSNGNGSSSQKIKKFPKSYEAPPKVRGFERDEMSLEIMLLEGGRNGSFKTVGVVGLPGVGKTTLCKSILKNERVMGSYDQRIWVSLSEPDKPISDEEHQELFKNALEQIGVADEIVQFISDEYKVPGLLEALNEKLKDKKYLIVVDDVGEGDGDGSCYEALKTCFSDRLPKEKGGAVIVISRSEETARKVMVEEKNLHRLMPLSDVSSCWLIYKDSVKGSAKSASYKLPSKDVMEELMNKCGGLPGAAQMLGKIKAQKLFRNFRSAVKAIIFIHKLKALRRRRRRWQRS